MKLRKESGDRGMADIRKRLEEQRHYRQGRNKSPVKSKERRYTLPRESLD